MWKLCEWVVSLTLFGLKWEGQDSFHYKSTTPCHAGKVPNHHDDEPCTQADSNGIIPKWSLSTNLSLLSTLFSVCFFKEFEKVSSWHGARKVFRKHLICPSFCHLDLEWSLHAVSHKGNFAGREDRLVVVRMLNVDKKCTRSQIAEATFWSTFLFSGLLPLFECARQALLLSCSWGFANDNVSQNLAGIQTAGVNSLTITIFLYLLLCLRCFLSLSFTHPSLLYLSLSFFCISLSFSLFQLSSFPERDPTTCH